MNGRNLQTNSLDAEGMAEATMVETSKLVNKVFDRAFVCEASRHNFSGLMDLCNSIVFVTSGRDNSLEELRISIEKNLADYDPDKDIFVPIGKVTSVFFCAVNLCSRFETVQIAFFNNMEYTPCKVQM